MIDRNRKAIKRLVDILDLMWARIGAESLMDRGITSRMSIDIDVSIGMKCDYVELAGILRKNGINAPLHTEKGMRKTQRRGVLITDVDGVQIDFHFKDEHKIRDYEDIVFEVGKLTKIKSPFLTLEDHLIRKLERYLPIDQSDIDEILKSNEIDFNLLGKKISKLNESDRNKVRFNLNKSY